MYIMLLNLVHQLKWETNSILYLLGPTFTFSSGDVLGPLSERLPWAPKFYYHPWPYHYQLFLNFSSENDVAAGQRKTFMVKKSQENLPINI